VHEQVNYGCSLDLSERFVHALFPLQCLPWRSDNGAHAMAARCWGNWGHAGGRSTTGECETGWWL